MKPHQIALLFLYPVIISAVVILAYNKYFASSKMPRIYSVNSKYIVELKTNELKEKVLSGKGDNVSEKDVIKYLQDIDTIVNEIALQNGALVVVTQMVVSKNVKDITDDVIKIYNERNKGSSLKLDENVLK